MEWKHPSIIALKGFPFTGKTNLSMDLAYHLRFCLLLSLDDIIDSISPSEGSTELIAQAFEVLCVQAEKQLSIGLSVIIDSLPLSRPHLDRLARLSTIHSTKIVLLECQIDRSYAWQMRYKKKYPYNNNNGLPWYKAHNWEEVTDTVKDYDKRIDEPVSGVSRLYLNVDESVRGRHVIEAIQTLVFCPDDRHVDYKTWSSYNLSIMHNYEFHHHDHDHHHATCGHDHGAPAGKQLLSRRLVSQTTKSCTDGHRIGVFAAEGLIGYNTDCLVCDNPVSGPAYTCNSCHAALHKSCAELQLSYTPQEFPAFINNNSDLDVYSFPENHACFHCRESGKEFSDGCSGCVFKSLLTCRRVPTVTEHDGHAHKLSLWAMKIEGKGEYTCGACGEKGAYAAYGCDGCETNYHVQCALLPYPIRDHKHGGYQHTVELLFEREDKEFDDFPCSYCLENMSPEDWYYYCAICYQTYHLKCAFKDEDDHHV